MRLCREYRIKHSEFLDWSEEDRAKAIAEYAHNAAICSMCGTAPWEWDEEQGGSKFAYEPVVEICPGCERKDWMRDSKENDRAGSYVSLKRPEE